MGGTKIKLLIIILFVLLLSSLILEIYPINQNCNQLCFYGTLSNNFANGTLYLNKTALKYALIKIVLNNRQNLIYTTSKEGRFDIYIPFNLGYNNINLYYNKYKDSISIFYLGDFSNFIIIIFAVFIYFIIKEISDFKLESKSIRLRYNKYNTYTPSEYNPNKNAGILKIDKIIANTLKKVNNMQIIKNSALTLKSIIEEYNKYLMYTDLNILNDTLYYEIENESKINKKNYIFSNLVSIGDQPLKSIAIKKLYEYALDNANFKIENELFLQKNNIILINEINQNKVLQILNNEQKVTVALLAGLEENKFIELLSKNIPISSLFLSMILLNKVDVLAL
ncbi:MAG: hypothetical protein ACP5RQ_00025 [Candidatus Micrarchaeia archaeon]